MNQSDESGKLGDTPERKSLVPKRKSLVPLKFYAEIDQNPGPSSSPAVRRRRTSPARPVVKQSGKFRLLKGRRSQYIKFHKAAIEGNLPYSEKLRQGETSNLYKLHAEGSLVTLSNRFVAQVTVEPSRELDQETSFVSAKKLLLKNLKVVRVLLDEPLPEVEQAWKVCDDQLKTAFEKNDVDDDQNAEDLFQLEKILSCAKGNCQKVGAEIKNNGYMSHGTKKIILKCIEVESDHVPQHRMFNMNNTILESQSCIGILQRNVQAGTRNYKTQLLEICRDFMKDPIEKLQDSHVLLVTRKDLQLFADLNSIPECTTIMNLMTHRYYNMVLNLKPNQLKAVRPTTNHILFYICKSFSELSKEVGALTSFTDIAKYTVDGWMQTNVVPWSPAPSMLERSLEYQIKILLNLMNHFDVGNSSSGQRFPYEFKVFGDIEANAELKYIIEHVNRVFGRCSDDKLPEDLRVWIYLLDDNIAQLFVDNQPIKKLCSALLNVYLLGQLTVDSLESFRTITHHTIRFVAESFVNSQNDRDDVILQKLVNFMSRASVERRMTYTDYCDLIEVYGKYWNKLCTTIDSLQAKIPGDHFKTDVEDIRKLLLQCMKAALDKNVQLEELKNFYRAFENLLLFLQNLTLDWFVQISKYERIFVEREALAVVQHSSQCYRVKNAETFTKLHLALIGQLPPHYGIEAVKSQLTCINEMIGKNHWSTGQALTESDQLTAAMGLMDLAKSMESHFNKQPDYIKFEAFFEKCTEPFRSISSKSTSLEDLLGRVAEMQDGNASSSQIVL